MSDPQTTDARENIIQKIQSVSSLEELHAVRKKVNRLFGLLNKLLAKDLSPVEEKEIETLDEYLTQP